MYADQSASRYNGRRGFDPGAMAMALALGGTAVFLFGLSLTAPNFVTIPEKILTGIAIPLPPVPKPKDPPKPQPRQKNQPVIDTPRPDPVDVTKPVATANPTGNLAKPVEELLNTGTVVGTSTGTLPTLPAHLPVDLAAKLDARYAGSFQPEYPVGERNAEHEGRVVVRVLIGTDGRVKAVEQVSAPSAAFFEATRKRALEKWRFVPASRDGVPYEAWQTIGVRFLLDRE